MRGKPPGQGAAATSRRGFLGATLAGAGSTLLGACGSGKDSMVDAGDAGFGDPIAAWNGPGGVGDYAQSNGISWQTMEAGHRIRDGLADTPAPPDDAGEHFDLVIVGGGFGGLGALHHFRKLRPQGTCLLIDNQEIFGGYAKANGFDVDGFRLAGGQASFNAMVPAGPADRAAALWAELGLPRQPAFLEREDADPAITFARSTSGPLYLGEQTASMGYFFGEQGWVKDIFSDDLVRAPWAEPMKRTLLAMREHKRRGPPDAAEARRLDAMTFADFATSELGATPEALKFITQGMCITGPQISAYGARALPGLERSAPGSIGASFGDRFVSFPSGNSHIARALVKAAIPDAFDGNATTSEAFGRLRIANLDRAGQGCRIRQSATVVRCSNTPAGAVELVYEKAGRQHRVTANGAVLAIGAWVAKRIVGDLPDTHRKAFDRYFYSPMLMANIALRQWRFLDRLKISAARWFDGTGFYCSVRQPMIDGGGAATPFHPDKPIILTMYIPFPRPDLPLEAQGADARAEMYATAHATYERRILDQLQRMFGSAGFDASRDVAEIVLNRWGHAFVTPPPGFFFGRDGQAAPATIVEQPVGNIALGQNGLEDWAGAALAGRRAVEQLLAG